MYDEVFKSDDNTSQASLNNARDKPIETPEGDSFGDDFQSNNSNTTSRRSNRRKEN